MLMGYSIRPPPAGCARWTEFRCRMLHKLLASGSQRRGDHLERPGQAPPPGDKHPEVRQVPADCRAKYTYTDCCSFCFVSRALSIVYRVQGMQRVASDACLQLKLQSTFPDIHCTSVMEVQGRLGRVDCSLTYVEQRCARYIRHDRFARLQPLTCGAGRSAPPAGPP